MGRKTLAQCAQAMYLRANKRKKDGKEHRYWSVEESRCLPAGRVVQRRVLYLGEINDSQQAAWRKTLEVFDEVEQRARVFGSYWLGCEWWEALGLSAFWEERLARGPYWPKSRHPKDY